MKNSSGTTLYSGGSYADAYPNFPALITENWVLPMNDCYTFTINDVYGDGIYAEGGDYRILNSAGTVVVAGNDYGDVQVRTFKVTGTLSTNEVTKEKNGIGIYPNPVNDILYVTNVSDKSAYKIYSVAGQLIVNGNISGGKITVSSLLKGNYVITIEEKGKDVFTSKFIKK